jgi:hypothetical protein
MAHHDLVGSPIAAAVRSRKRRLSPMKIGLIILNLVLWSGLIAATKYLF